MFLHDLAVVHWLVVKPGKIDLVGELVANRILPLIERRSRGPCWIFLVKKGPQPASFLPTIRLCLFGNFVADAPHADAGVITIASHHVAKVTFRPFVVVLAVPVRNFATAPHIKSLI